MFVGKGKLKSGGWGERGGGGWVCHTSYIEACFLVLKVLSFFQSPIFLIFFITFESTEFCIKFFLEYKLTIN